MPSNAEAADRLREIADLLDLTGEKFKPEAYRRAARSLETLTEELAVVAARNGLRDVPGVGAAIAEKLAEYLATGRIAYLDRLRSEIPAGLLDLMRLPGIGPKTTRRFWTELGITGRDDLERAVGAGRLVGMSGFGDRKIQQVREALESAPGIEASSRRPIETVYAIARSIREALRTRAPTERVEIAGSFRRGRETVGDLDILVTSDSPEKVFDRFSELPEIAAVRLRGGTKETVVLHGGLQVDLRVVAPEAFGAALQYFTGSKEHNVRLRSLARDRGLKINEYGVFRGEERVGGRTEEEVYELLGVPWIPPELREDRGEIDSAREGRLPRLVEATDLGTDLHVHLAAAEGPRGLAAVLARARAAGLDSVGVVVAAPGTGGRLVSVPDEIVRSIAAAADGPVRPVPVLEISPQTPPGEGARIRADYVVLRPGPDDPAPGSPTGRGAPVRLVAHVGGDPVAAHGWIVRAHALGAAVETGPGPERVDSSLAASARTLGVPLAVATGVGEPDGVATGAVALGFARRAGAGREAIANARVLPTAAPGSPPARRRSIAG